MNAVLNAPAVRVLDVIKHRRSVGQVTQEQPTQAQIEQMLEAAVYAPSHHVTEPWHFFVVTGTARERLGDAMAASLAARMEKYDEGLPEEKKRVKLLRERNKPLRAPVIIVATMRGALHQEGLLIENIEATAAAVQNMLLTAEEMGLATLWRTGDTAYDPVVKRWFGLALQDHIVGFIYVGYPKVTRSARIPTHYSVKTTWLS